MIKPAIALLCLFALPALAQEPSDPDTSFGVNGIVANPFGAAGNEGHRLVSMAELPDGRILLAGQRLIDVGGTELRLPLLGLLNASGAPVTAGDFVNGVFIHDFTPPGQEGWINRVLALPTGEILYCGGHTGSGATGADGNRAVIGRLGSNLQRDLSFGIPTEGRAREQILDFDYDCTGVELLTNGNIAYGGSADQLAVALQPGQTRQRRMTMALLDPNGRRINGFGVNGIERISAWGTQGGHVGVVLNLTSGFIVAAESAGTQETDPDFIPVFSGRMRSYAETGTSAATHSAPLGAHPLVRGYAAALPDGGSLAYGEIIPKRSIVRRDGNAQVSEIYSFDRTDGRPAGFALLADGRMVVARIQQSETETHNARIELINALGVQFRSDAVLTEQPIFAGNRELLDVGDLLVQQDGRHLILLNRRQETIATAARTPIRPVLRRFQGNPLSGATWNLDLTPDPIILGNISVRPNVQALSQIAFIEGLSPGVSVPIAVSGGELTVNFDPWSSHPRWVKNGDLIRVRGFGPSADSGSTVVRVEVGGVRAAQNWRPLGSSGSVVTADFVISSSLPPLPGIRCSSVGAASNCSGGIPDNSAAGITSSLPLVYAFPAQCGYIRSVRVGVDITHSWVGDLRITLRDPNGQVFIGGSTGFVNLLDRPGNLPGGNLGSCRDNNVLATFDQQASIPADRACALFPDSAAISGEVLPSQPLSALVGRRTTGNDGASSTGTWQLTVRDLAGGDIGTLNDWSLDVDCSETPPNAADLVTTVTGPTRIVGGTAATVEFTVRNDGPSASGNVLFDVELPSSPGQGYANVLWSCTATPGSSCTQPASGCLFGLCPLPVNPVLNLAAAGEATISINGSVDPGADGSQALAIEGRAWIPLAINSAFDPDPSNNHALFNRDIERDADLEALALTVTRFEANRLRLFGRFANQGPSLALPFSSFLTLPVGYQIEPGSWTCTRGGADCGGSSQISLGGRELTLNNLGSTASGASYHWEVFATWVGVQPEGQASLIVAHGAGSAATDPLPDNNGVAVSIPTSGSVDSIFSNGFE